MYAAALAVGDAAVHAAIPLRKVGSATDFMSQMPGFVSTLLMTAHERGRGLAVVVFETHDQAQQLANGFSPGQQGQLGRSNATDVEDR